MMQIKIIKLQQLLFKLSLGLFGRVHSGNVKTQWDAYEKGKEVLGYRRMRVVYRQQVTCQNQYNIDFDISSLSI